MFKAHRHVYHSTQGWGVIKKQREELEYFGRVGEVCRRHNQRFQTRSSHTNTHHRVTSLVRNRPPPQGCHKALGIFLLWGIPWPRRRSLQKAGGFVFQAHILVYHSTLGWRVIKRGGILWPRRRSLQKARSARPRAPGSGLRLLGLGCGVWG